MKATRLEVVYDYDFEVYGINSSYKPHKLAWQLNQSLNLHLKKVEDLYYEFIKESSKLYFVMYKYDTMYGSFKLIKNKAIEYYNTIKPFMIPELRNFDYLMVVTAPDFESQSFLQTLKSISLLEYVNHVDISNLKSKENLIF